MATAYEARHPFQLAAAAAAAAAAVEDGSVEELPFKTPMSPPPPHLGHLSAHSGFPFSDPETDHAESDDSLDEEDDDSHSVGGYSPPAWRRLGNGSRSSGFWRQRENHYFGHNSNANNPLRQQRMSRDSSSFPPDEDVLEQAIRTRLPTGSLSPEKGRTPDPDVRTAEDDTLIGHVKSERGSPLKGGMDDENLNIMASMSPEAARNNCGTAPSTRLCAVASANLGLD